MGIVKNMSPALYARSEVTDISGIKRGVERNLESPQDGASRQKPKAIGGRST